MALAIWAMEVTGILPLISVIIPTYNRSTLVARAAKSVLEQSYQNLELIIVDDASTDNTEKVVSAIGSSRIRYYKNDINLGAQAARNIGLKKAKGEYVAFLDSDDVWYPQKLELQYEAFKKAPQEVGVVYSYADVIDEGKKVRSELIYQHRGNIYRNLLAYPDIDFITPLVKYECFEKIGFLDENVPAFQEWDTFIRIAKFYEFELVPQKLAAYYTHGGTSISKDFKKDIKGYFYVVNKHKAEIIRTCGLNVMLVHYLRLSYRFVRFFPESCLVSFCRRLRKTMSKYS